MVQPHFLVLATLALLACLVNEGLLAGCLRSLQEVKEGLHVLRLPGQSGGKEKGNDRGCDQAQAQA